MTVTAITAAFLRTGHETLPSSYIITNHKGNEFFRKTFGEMRLHVSDPDRSYTIQITFLRFIWLLNIDILRNVINHVVVGSAKSFRFRNSCITAKKVAELWCQVALVTDPYHYNDIWQRNRTTDKLKCYRNISFHFCFRFSSFRKFRPYDWSQFEPVRLGCTS